MSGQSGRIALENGRVIVTDPKEGGRAAVLYPPDEGLSIYINGELLEVPIEVREEDVIEIEPLTLVEEPKIEVQIAPGGLAASMAVYPQVTTSYRVKDSEPAFSLKPQAEKNVEEEKKITLEEAEKELERNNVLFGVEFAALKEAVSRSDGEFRRVARGKEAVEGHDGWFEYLINPEVEEIQYGNEELRVDYREKYRFPSVSEGDVIAVVHPAEEGTPGQRVTGDLILPQPVKSPRVKLGEGVDYEDNKVVALKEGRLSAKGNFIKVVNLLVHNGDVDLESGNLRFKGDIRIYGNITEGMEVESGSDLYVQGNSFGATIRAGGGIEFGGNVIKCHVQGGRLYGQVKELLPSLENLEKEVNGITKNVDKVIEGLSSRGQPPNKEQLGKVIGAILSKQGFDWNEGYGNMEKLLQESNDPRLESMKKIVKVFKEIVFQERTVEDAGLMKKILDHLGGNIQELKLLLEEVPPVEIPYLQNSSISHSGSIRIVGKGSYFSSLYAGGEVEVQGVFRGGSIKADGNVKVKEFVSIGVSPGGGEKSSARVIVPPSASIYFENVNEDTPVQIGRLIYRFEKNYSRVQVSYNADSAMVKVKTL